MTALQQPTISRRLSVVECLQRSNRRILVIGAPGTGKTTFSCSASELAGEKLPVTAEPLLLSDTAYIQGDNEGVVGAYRAGLEPGAVYDVSPVNKWDDYLRELIAILRECKGESDAGRLKYLVIDLAHPTRLISEKIDPSVQKDWKEVAALGAQLFRAFNPLRGVTVIGNAQIKRRRDRRERASRRRQQRARCGWRALDLYGRSP